MTDSKSPHQKPVRYMDFISKKPKANADPLASRPASRTARPMPKPEKVHSVSDQIPPKGTHIIPPKPEPKKAEVPVKKTEQKPYVSREPAKSRDLYPESKPEKPKANDDLALKASAALSGTSKPAEKSSPDNNAYSLGGKSPFLPNYSIEKRPLSNSVPTKKTDANFEKLSFLGVNEDAAPKKNIYEKKSTKSEKSSTKDKKDKTVKIIDDTKEKRGLPVIVIVIITILLGAAVGAGVYFLLPK